MEDELEQRAREELADSMPPPPKPAAMSLPDSNGTPDAPGSDPPNPQSIPVEEPAVDEVHTPRDAIFLTEVQQLAEQVKTMNRYQAQALANSFLATGLLVVIAYYLMRQGAKVPNANP